MQFYSVEINLFKVLFFWLFQYRVNKTISLIKTNFFTLNTIYYDSFKKFLELLLFFLV